MGYHGSSLHSFTAHSEMTLHEYLLSVRIERARSLLMLREYSVTDAANICVFISLSHFLYVFRKITGVSPSEYREKYFEI